MAKGQRDLEISYSKGFTAFSFFLPITVLLAAFVALGTNYEVSWWRVGIGGTLVGAAICGMHYLGNASINNYICIYSVPNVVGAVIIAVMTCTISFSALAISRARWTSFWWSRGISAVVLAAAVSGMHWCASTGTQYRLKSVPVNNNLSRRLIVVIVMCLVRRSLMNDHLLTCK